MENIGACLKNNDSTIFNEKCVTRQLLNNFFVNTFFVSYLTFYEQWQQIELPLITKVQFWSIFKWTKRINWFLYQWAGSQRQSFRSFLSGRTKELLLDFFWIKNMHWKLHVFCKRRTFYPNLIALSSNWLLFKNDSVIDETWVPRN